MRHTHEEELWFVELCTWLEECCRQDDAEEVSVEEGEEAANETEESETLNISTAPGMSDILLISGTTGISIGMVAYLLLKAWIATNNS